MTTATIHVGDALTVLRTLPDASVHCCVTSPPYWGLRDYGTASWDGGDPACDHVVAELHSKTGLAACSKAHGGGGSTPYVEIPKLQARDVCPHCGARRIDQQIGLEETPDQFVAKLVEVFEEVRRVLRDDGVLWLNLGDSYASGAVAGVVDAERGLRTERFNDKRGYRGDRLANGRGDQPAVLRQKTRADRVPEHAGDWPRGVAMGAMRQPNRVPVPGLKPKDLVGIPWMVAFALRAAGWWLRSECVWHKPNPMPESTRDRPTKAHEQVFLLTKSRQYFYDDFAVRQPYADSTLPQKGRPYGGVATKDYEQGRAQDPSETKRRVVESLERRGGANLRTVWTIATQPFKGAHFATFPKELADRCILAGTSAHGCCPTCSAPWERVTETSYDADGRRGNGPRSTERRHVEFGTAGFEQRLVSKHESKGWQPTCECFGEWHEEESDTSATGKVWCWTPPAEPMPPLRRCVVLDPFTGAGTTALAATLLGRDFVGCELNPEFAAMARKRVADEMPLFARAAGGGA